MPSKETPKISSPYSSTESLNDATENEEAMSNTTGLRLIYCGVIVDILHIDDIVVLSSISLILDIVPERKILS